MTANARRILDAIAKQEFDPFQGTSQRHVISADMSSCDMEAAAATDAIQRAGLQVGDIDIVLSHTVAPEFQLTNSGAKLHRQLGLRDECFVIQAEAAAYSFLGQLTLAESMIRAGRGRCALLVQSSASTRLVDATSPISPLCGDGASAVIVGAVESRGMRGAIHFADGSHFKSLVAGVPGGTWYDEGRVMLHIADPASMQSVLLQTVDLCQRSVEALLQRVGITPGEIDFFCIHQGTAWLRELAQASCGMAGARSVDTFSKTAYLFGAIMPFGLRAAEDLGLLSAGNQVMMFGGGTGMTYGATLMEWGR
ncbi:MAG: 3-oxoacyl-ACP synthase III family protein [Kofleriaceae bacterium]